MNNSHDEERWMIAVLFSTQSQVIYMPERVAKKLVADLNSGRVEL